MKRLLSLLFALLLVLSLCACQQKEETDTTENTQPQTEAAPTESVPTESVPEELLTHSGGSND